MIYFDNAATTYPKPMGVSAAVVNTLITPFGNAGRGAHAAALRAADAVFEARKALSDLFGLSDERRVVFAKNATEALNLAILGVLGNLRGKARVVTSVLEHNSVLRPLYHLERCGKINLSFFVPSEEPELCEKNFRACVSSGVDFVVLTACANTTGLSLPLGILSDIAHAAGALVLVDAAQAAGHQKLTFSSCRADYVCVPAHKGLYGITGLGALLVGKRSPVPLPLLFGGAGFDSQSREMPNELPERLEAGTVPIHAASALCAGIGFVESRGVEQIGERVAALSDAFRAGLLDMGFSVYSPRGAAMMLFNVDDLQSADVAERLDEKGICVRAGYHCAPLAHAFLGTHKRGALRASFGAFNTFEEVESALSALHHLYRT